MPLDIYKKKMDLIKGLGKRGEALDKKITICTICNCCSNRKQVIVTAPHICHILSKKATIQNKTSRKQT